MFEIEIKPIWVLKINIELLKTVCAFKDQSLNLFYFYYLRTQMGSNYNFKH